MRFQHSSKQRKLPSKNNQSMLWLQQRKPKLMKRSYEILKHQKM